MGCALINWREYNNSLVQRGDFTIYIPLNVERKWFSRKGRKKERGRPLLYSNFAILVMGAIQQLCLLPLRQTQGFVKALFTIANKVIPVPNYTTLCRRRRKVVIPKVNRRGSSVCLIVDSTGLKTVGAGEWRERLEKGRKSWLKIHIAFDYKSGEVINWSITKEKVHDVRIFPRLLRGVEGKIEEIIGDSAYDSRKIYQEVEKRGARAIIPPRKGARICHYIGKGPPTQRDKHIEEIFKIGEKEWKDKNGYHRRNAIESFISRLKRRFGGVVRARSPAGQRSEIGIRIALLNQWRELERFQTIDSSS